jgi:hypothetical protein
MPLALREAIPSTARGRRAVARGALSSAALSAYTNNNEGGRALARASPLCQHLSPLFYTLWPDSASLTPRHDPQLGGYQGTRHFEEPALSAVEETAGSRLW